MDVHTQTGDVVAAVNFARENNLRLVIKGGGHSYLGTSNAPDSLLIWTRFMDDVTLHDGFVVQGKYDPGGLFFVHHGVGSDKWSADGFTRLTGA